VKQFRRISVLLAILVGVVTVKFVQGVYQWIAYADERTLLVQLREQTVDIGADVVRTAAQADTLRASIEQFDRRLDESRRTVERYGRFASQGMLPRHLYDSYRSDLAAYDAEVARRNEMFSAWKEIVRRNQDAVERYNALADSVRLIANQMGDPYYPVPLPAEAALERGLVPTASALRRDNP
jgi:hypothetical protein